MRDKLIALLKQLSLHQDVHQITAEALAQAAHIPLETVLQTLGSVQNYPALLAYEQPNITRERILSAAIAQGQRGEPMQAVAQLFAQAWARSATDHQWTRLYLEVMSQAQEPEIAQRLESLYSHIWHLSGEFVAVMQAGGLTRSDIPQQDLAMLWCVMFDGVTATAIANPQLDVQKLAQKFIPILWHGLAPKNTQGNTSC